MYGKNQALKRKFQVLLGIEETSAVGGIRRCDPGEEEGLDEIQIERRDQRDVKFVLTAGCIICNRKEGFKILKQNKI